MNTIIILFVLSIVVYVIISASKKPAKGVPSRGTTIRRNSVQASQVANDVRILMESLKIVSETKNYSVKISRSKLIEDVLVRLENYNTEHIRKDEEWERLLSNYRIYYSKITQIDSKYLLLLSQLQGERTAKQCPYCAQEAFAEGSRAVKCPNCGQKAVRLKISKTEAIMVTLEEQDNVKAIEEEGLNLFLSGAECNITLSQEVSSVLAQMEAKKLNKGS
ncbi:MAG: hypothetical protein PHR32_05190 [Candidatus Cloacimonetes bacterium]|jgi:predicted RNA-binding Zn-ribbon protein involved in translation (DUF1610 family)|nr:hypothetical protein [Candidatus Cloacimonadota bacterium]